MEAKLKAEKLLKKMLIGAGYDLDIAMRCALIAVDEILEDRKEVDGMRVINDPYWLEVKNEIEQL
jgi:hypothetical protein